MTLGHRLLVLNEGVVEQLGTPIELYERPASVFVAGFIGSPSMNFLAARVAAEGGAVELPGGDRLTLAEGALTGQAGRQVTLGIRPEHLEAAAEGAGDAHLTVEVVEQLGADTLVHGHFGSDRSDLTVRLPGVSRLEPGAVLPLAVAPAHLHLFDPDSGARLDGSPR